MLGFKVIAPDFKGIKAWLNTKPLTMGKLKGKVVLVEFWTYTCINCLRSIPFLKRMRKKYGKKGLVVIGVHSPEFSFEEDLKNVEKAVKDLKIQYPVAVDSDMETWRTFDNIYWPAKYIIDKEGYIVDVNFGEGHYQKTEAVIQELLGISKKLEDEPERTYTITQSPETYTGFIRNNGLGSGLVCGKDGCDRYVDFGDHEPNVIYPDGQWEQRKSCLELIKAPGKLNYLFYARQVNLIMEPVGKKVKADILIDGKKTESISVDKPTIYTVYQEKDYAEHELSIIFKGKVKVYAYTFG
jgi:thiol-disulfide isomerase/thioredoxin